MNRYEGENKLLARKALKKLMRLQKFKIEQIIKICYIKNKII